MIEMPDAPAEQKEKALVYRGVTYGKLTPPQTDKAIADWATVIEMPDALAECKKIAEDKLKSI
ncbi:MAG TPA: hypothetical protein DCX07_14600 [Phycisphaerales bacterium]|nr:hypothetical protein [Phycisphaerales bacterium]